MKNLLFISIIFNFFYAANAQNPTANPCMPLGVTDICFTDFNTFKSNYQVGPGGGYEYRYITTVKVEYGHYNFIALVKPNGLATQHIRGYIPVENDKYIPVAYSNLISTSIITVPFKVRPAIKGLKNAASADIKNVGLVVGPSYFLERTLYNGKIITHRGSAGLLVAPGVATYDSANTEGRITTATTQATLSLGLALTYSYGGITIAAIPIGFDIGLTKDSRQWVYNKRYWYGFGIGIDLKLLSVF